MLREPQGVKLFMIALIFIAAFCYVAVATIKPKRSDIEKLFTIMVSTAIGMIGALFILLLNS